MISLAVLAHKEMWPFGRQTYKRPHWVVEISPSDGDLRTQLKAKIAAANSLSREPLVGVWSQENRNCRSMERMLASNDLESNAYLILIDRDVWADQLVGTEFANQQPPCITAISDAGTLLIGVQLPENKLTSLEVNEYIPAIKKLAALRQTIAAQEKAAALARFEAQLPDNSAQLQGGRIRFKPHFSEPPTPGRKLGFIYTATEPMGRAASTITPDELEFSESSGEYDARIESTGGNTDLLWLSKRIFVPKQNEFAVQPTTNVAILIFSGDIISDRKVVYIEAPEFGENYVLHDTGAPTMAFPKVSARASVTAAVGEFERLENSMVRLRRLLTPVVAVPRTR